MRRLAADTIRLAAPEAICVQGFYLAASKGAPKGIGMRISHRYRFIFFANPKTGSVSIREFLDPYSDVPIARTFASTSADIPFYPHMRPVEAAGCFRRLGWDFEGYTKLVCVRNPWARVVSLYRHLRDTADSLPPFDRWVRTLSTDGRGGGGGRGDRWRRYGAYSLRNFVSDERGTPLVDVVLRLEDVDRELKPCLERLRLPGLETRPIPHKNDRSKGESYVDFYTPETQAHIAALYGDDIERFGYEFGE